MNRAPSSTSNFNVSFAAFILAVLISVCLLEIYCRASKRFDAFEFAYIRTITTVDAHNAVLGDSHVGLTPMIEGYSFLGQAGQQPRELLNLVHYLYGNRPPGMIIVEAAPQWVGEYHKGRTPLLTTTNLRPPISVFGVHMLSLSPLYSGSLFRFLVADLLSWTAVISKSRAEQPPIDPNQVHQYANEWSQKYEASPATFNWSQIESEKRGVLTAARVYDQNPIKDFETSDGLRDYAAAIRFLKERGAEVCLFRTPVTSDYLRIARQMPEGRFDAFDGWIRTFAKTQDIRLVDFRELSLTFDDTTFLNQDHVTSSQAKIMWPLVADACFAAKK